MLSTLLFLEKVLFQHGIIEVWLFLHKFSKRALSIYLPLVTNDNAAADVFLIDLKLHLTAY